MKLKKALNERLQKAKYIKRWRSKDGKWKYKYKPGGGYKRTRISKKPLPPKALRSSTDEYYNRLKAQDSMRGWKESALRAAAARLLTADNLKRAGKGVGSAAYKKRVAAAIKEQRGNKVFMGQPPAYRNAITALSKMFGITTSNMDLMFQLASDNYQITDDAKIMSNLEQLYDQRFNLLKE